MPIGFGGQIATEFRDMGVSGLLQLLQPATVNIHVAAYKGKRVAVDAYCWLHKGAYACAYDLAIGAKTDL